MESWSVRTPVRLPGAGRQLRLHDTASRSVRPAGTGSIVRMYVCGITPYDATHLGHAATFVAFDTAHRVWVDAGRDVHYVQNVTDVDDPLLERADATGQDWRDVARAGTDLFRRDMAALNVLPPREYVGVVESIPSIVEWIQRLRDAGAVYEVQGDLYFAAGRSPAIGSIAGLDAAAMPAVFGERGGDPDRPGKRDPLDCVVWRAARPDEPAWDSALGRGRPGWHIECAAIALDHLGVGFDVQGGGSDLAFPHHEMSAALGERASGRRPFAQHHVHAGMVAHAGHKMSKSRGNLVFVSHLLAGGVPPAVIRLALLGHHYRSDWEWREADLVAARARAAAWRAALSGPAGPPAHALRAGVRERLADDLDTPGALDLVDRWVDAHRDPGRATRGTDVAAPGLVRALLDALLGIDLS